MKKLLTFALCLTLLVGCLSVLTACNDNQTTTSAQKDPGFTYELVSGATEEESYLVVTGYNVSDEVNELVSQQNFSDEKVQAVSKIEIPSGNVEYKRNGQVIGSYPVKEIDESAFANMLFIKEVVIPENIETIGSACLAGCTNLEKLTVNFVGNKKDGNVNAKKTLGYLFGTQEVANATSSTVKYNASGSATYYIPNSLKTIVLTGDTVGEYAFNGFTNVEEIVLPETVLEYGAYAFANCSSLYKFAIGANVTKIGDNAFSGCTSLVNPNFADATSLTYIGDSAFSGCTQLFYSVSGGVYTASANLTYIGAQAFANCTALEEVSLLGLTTATVGDGAFSGCENVTKVTLPVDATNISYGSLVFTGCNVKKENVVNYVNNYLFDFDYDV